MYIKLNIFNKINIYVEKILMYQRNKTFYWEISQKFVSKIQKEVP